ncbi:hypothetical protein [Psychrobacillus sp. NPDC093200]|uniref:hypothetical protein n=1 Tax=Psychrobacillus sp. NPDC093200 TaxID=3390656 RepID=UPI003CFE6C99
MERALTNIINSENLNDYPLFKEFCQYKEKGLRKQSFHHISEDLYLGNIQEDRLLLKEIEQLSEKVEKEEYKINIYQLVSYYSNLMSDWISFSSEGTVGFVQWCEDKGKAYEFTKIYYYEK